MAFLDFLTEDIREQERIANEAARERFDPSFLNPQQEEASRRAQEGIVDEPIRQQGLERIFASIGRRQSDVGAGQGRFLSLLEEESEGRAEAVSNLETEIGLQEEKAKRKGRAQEAEIQSKKQQLRNEREARIKRNRLMAEAKASSRKRKFLGSIAKFGIAAAGGAPAIGSALGINLSKEGSDFSDVLGDIARSSVPNPEPQDDIIEEDIDFSLGGSQVDFMDRLMRGELGIGF